LDEALPGRYALTVDADGRVYLGTFTGEIWATGKDDRIYRWASGVDGQIYFLESDSNGDLYVGTSKQRIYRFANGDRLDWVGKREFGFEPRFEHSGWYLENMLIAGEGSLVVAWASDYKYANDRKYNLESFSETEGALYLTDPGFQNECQAADNEGRGYTSSTCFRSDLVLQGVDPDGNIMIGSSSARSIRRSFAPNPEEVAFFRDPLGDVAYSFDERGRHLSTSDLITG